MPKLSKAEQKRRKDITQDGVAQESLDKLKVIKTKRMSSSEVFTKHGYSLSSVLKLAIAEKERIISELRSKPSKDVESDILDVAKIKTDEEIPEFVEP